MNTFHYQGTSSTPDISFGEDNRLVIKGRSIPANEAKFFKPVIDWAGTLILNVLTVEINLEYLNSGSSKMLLHLLKTLDANPAIQKLIIRWYYEAGDEEAYESGKVFKELLHKAEFRFCRYRNAS